MVAVLLILDGASEPLRPGEPTSLELARTPVLDRLASEGPLTRLRTVAPGLAPGSEAAIPALLGWTPTAPVDRGALEAAAYEIAVRVDERAWRVDVVTSGGDARRPTAAVVARAAAWLAAAVPGYAVHLLSGHRLLVVGRSDGGVCRICQPEPYQSDTPSLRVWPEGIVPPRILDAGTVLVGARGAAIGIARLMGATTVVPAGASGLTGSDLAAKAGAATRAIDGGAACVVVHVGGPDEAAHMCDRAAKVACIERADRELVAALLEAVRTAGGTLQVCPDHGCDPRTGEHDGAPVPCVTWSPGGVGAGPARRLTERAVADLPVVQLRSAAGALVAA
ncbi:MAG: hypothetical protein WKF42_00355 [Solirubrobacteraceae bacterium]